MRKKLPSLILGGTPARAIIISTWRSGSTFMGDLLKSHPAAYYHYEPLGIFPYIVPFSLLIHKIVYDAMLYMIFQYP